MPVGVGLPAPICFGQKAAAISPPNWSSLRTSRSSIGSTVPRIVRPLGHALVFILFTLLTQIGAIAYLLALLATRRWRWANHALWARSALVMPATLLIYAAASLVAVPTIAE